MVFDFGANEEAAQQARHKFESWKQAFRLGDKAVLKFERSNSEAPAEEAATESKPEKTTKAKTKHAAKQHVKKNSADAKAERKSEENAADNSDVRILIRLSFSDHEKLSYQRWLERIPSEEPFKSAKGKTVRHSDASFAKTADLFDSLD